jgi:hypothetical protein
MLRTGSVFNVGLFGFGSSGYIRSAFVVLRTGDTPGIRSEVRELINSYGGGTPATQAHLEVVSTGLAKLVACATYNELLHLVASTDS